MSIKAKRNVIIFFSSAFVILLCFVFNYFKQPDDFLRVIICPSGGGMQSYCYRISESGNMSCEFGTCITDDMTDEELIVKEIENLKLEYKQKRTRLTKDEMVKIRTYLENFDESIYDEEYPETDDSWELRFLYNGRAYTQCYYSLTPEVREFADYIIELSPIEVEMRAFA